MFSSTAPTGVTNPCFSHAKNNPLFPLVSIYIYIYIHVEPIISDCVADER